jgi:hypothetical protein
VHPKCFTTSLLSAQIWCPCSAGAGWSDRASPDAPLGFANETPATRRGTSSLRKTRRCSGAAPWRSSMSAARSAPSCGSSRRRHPRQVDPQPAELCHAGEVVRPGVVNAGVRQIERTEPRQAGKMPHPLVADLLTVQVQRIRAFSGCYQSGVSGVAFGFPQGALGVELAGGRAERPERAQAYGLFDS